MERLNCSRYALRAGHASATQPAKPNPLKGEPMNTARETLVKEVSERRIYGCTIAEMRADLEDSLTVKLSGYSMAAMSVLSDSQEEIEHGMKDRARQSINRAKWIIRTYLTPERK
jgi:hypothetical protein